MQQGTIFAVSDYLDSDGESAVELLYALKTFDLTHQLRTYGMMNPESRTHLVTGLVAQGLVARVHIPHIDISEHSIGEGEPEVVAYQYLLRTNREVHTWQPTCVLHEDCVLHSLNNTCYQRRHAPGPDQENPRDALKDIFERIEASPPPKKKRAPTIFQTPGVHRTKTIADADIAFRGRGNRWLMTKNRFGPRVTTPMTTASRNQLIHAALGRRDVYAYLVVCVTPGGRACAVYGTLGG